MGALIGSEVTPVIGAVFISEHWSKEAQLATRRAQVLAGTMDTRYEAEMRTGRIIHIAHVLNQAATAKSDNTLVVPDANTPTNQDITISRYFYTAANWQFQTQVQADIVSVETIAGQFGYALQGQVETDAAALPDDLATSEGTLGLELTMDDWEQAWQDLQVGLAPKEDRFAWLSSAAVSAIRKLGTPISADFTRSNLAAMDTATIGMFLGFKVIESQYLEAPATGQSESCAFQRQQFILIRQKQPTIERDRIVGDLSMLVVGWELFITAERQIVAQASGAEVLNDLYGVLLNTV